MNDKQSQHALAIGYQLHWYEIQNVLGVGGFGITYLARDGNLERSVAIKEFLPSELSVRKDDSTLQPASEEESSTYRWGLDRFLSEARTLARFQHPNIVRVHSVFEANNTAYMVMDYEQGQSLGGAFKNAEYRTEPALLELLVPLLDGLEEVHASGFIHRDIKPDNIFVRGDGRPVLLDFGSARQALGVETRTLTSLVSPGYAPFEQYNPDRNGDKQGPWTDIYALGATLYRAVTGKGPVDALTRAGAILRGHQDVLIPASAMATGRYSASFLGAIDGALAFQPEARPQTIAQWRRMFVTGTGAGKAKVDISLAASDDRDRTLVTIPGSAELAAYEKALRLDTLLGSDPAVGGEPHRLMSARRLVPLAGLLAGIVMLGAALWWYRQPSTPPALERVQALLDETRCTALVADLSENAVSVSGFGSPKTDVTGLRGAIAALPGVREVSMAIEAVDDRYCPLLEFYAPFWKANRNKRLGAVVTTPNPGNGFVDGETLMLSVTAPLYGAYLYVDYYFSDGSVIHLLPGQRADVARAEAGETLTLGEEGEWIVSPPFGRELLAVLASPVALFPDTRPEQESSANYLAALGERLKSATASNEHRPVSTDIVVITTKTKTQ